MTFECGDLPIFSYFKLCLFVCMCVCVCACVYYKCLREQQRRSVCTTPCFRCFFSELSPQRKPFLSFPFLSLTHSFLLFNSFVSLSLNFVSFFTFPPPLRSHTFFLCFFLLHHPCPLTSKSSPSPLAKERLGRVDRREASSYLQREKM